MSYNDKLDDARRKARRDEARRKAKQRLLKKLDFVCSHLNIDLSKSEAEQMAIIAQLDHLPNNIGQYSIVDPHQFEHNYNPLNTCGFVVIEHDQLCSKPICDLINLSFTDYLKLKYAKIILDRFGKSSRFLNRYITLHKRLFMYRIRYLKKTFEITPEELTYLENTSAYITKDVPVLPSELSWVTCLF